MQRNSQSLQGASFFALAIIFSAASAAFAADEVPWPKVIAAAEELQANAPKDDTLVLDALEARAGKVLGKLEHPTDRKSWQQAVPQLRKQLSDAIGIGLMPPPKVKHVTQVGIVRRGDYVIEKLTYETLPGVIVPVHVYRPAANFKRLPAILFVPGHWWADSKTHLDFQAFCINMARWGFVVLSYDPIGQGERGVSFREHRRTSGLLVGLSQQAVMVHESKCALEYLLSRDDVDPQKIGITGASGGGYNSWTMTALDERIACSVPVVGTSDFLLQIQVTRPLDWYQAKEHCHFIPGLLKFANNHEYLAMAAPRPVMILAAHNDAGFAVEGNRRIVSYGQKLYDALGASEKLAYFEDEQFGHGYQQPKRERAYGWLRHWLQGHGDGGPIKEPETETVRWNDPEMRCFPAWKNISAGPGIMDHIRRLAREKQSSTKQRPNNEEELRQRLVKVLGMPDKTPAATIKHGPTRKVGDVNLAAFEVQMADGVRLPGVVVSMTNRPRGWLLAVADEGQTALLNDSAVRMAIAEREMEVAIIDVRGCGRLKQTKPGWTFATSLLLGENFVGRAALDLTAVCQLITPHWRTPVVPGEVIDPRLQPAPIGILAIGPHATLASTYASVLDPQFAWLAQARGFISYRSFIDRRASIPSSYHLAASREKAWDNIDREIPAHLVPYNVLEQFDIAKLLHNYSTTSILIFSDAINGDWEPISEREMDRSFPSLRAFKEDSQQHVFSILGDHSMGTFLKHKAEWQSKGRSYFEP